MKLKVLKKILLRQRLLSLGFEEETGKDHIFFTSNMLGKLLFEQNILTRAKMSDNQFLV